MAPAIRDGDTFKIQTQLSKQFCQPALLCSIQDALGHDLQTKGKICQINHTPDYEVPLPRYLGSCISYCSQVTQNRKAKKEILDPPKTSIL